MHRVLIFAVLFLPLSLFLYVLVKYKVEKPKKLALSIGGAQGLMLYALFVYSEWRGLPGITELFLLMLSAAFVGSIFWLAYSLIGCLINKTLNKK